MEVFLKAGKILCLNRNFRKLFCNYNYENYFQCDSQVINDFVISNYYHYGDSIIYHKNIIDYLNKSLYDITNIENDKFKVKLKYEVIMYVKVREVTDSGEEILEEYIINGTEDKEYISDSVIYSNNEFAIKCFNEDDEFYINKTEKIKYEIIDKEFFIKKKNLIKTDRIIFCDKNFKNKIFVTRRPNNARELESITYLIRKEDGNLIYLNGYYNMKKNRYEVIGETIHNIKGLIGYLLVFSERGSNSTQFTDLNGREYYLNAESELAKYGYSVREGVTREERKTAIRNALKGGMTKGEIEKHLMYLISRDSGDPRLMNANEKRKEDLEYLRKLDLEEQRKVLLN